MPIEPTEIALSNLRASVLVYLHELKWADEGQRHHLTITANLAADGSLEADLQCKNLTTGELWGASL